MSQRTLILSLLASIILITLGLCVLSPNEEPLPDGLLWFCKVELNHNREIVAAWTSQKQPYDGLNLIQGYDDKGELIYETPKDTDAPKDSKTLDQRKLPKERIQSFYEEHKDAWVGKIPKRRTWSAR